MKNRLKVIGLNIPRNITATIENFILTQSIKDEMMAETIVYYMVDKNMGLPLIVIAGRFGNYK